MDEQTTTRVITTGILVALALVIYLAAIWSGGRLVARLGNRGPDTAERVGTLWLMLRRLILVALVVIFGLLVLQAWGVSLAPFLAVGTVVGVALGFGAQDLVKDLLAGFFILAEDQYRVGDSITIAGASGTVEDIQFRVTVLRDLEGNVHFVPNGQITVTSNSTSLFARPVFDVGIAYSEDVDRAIAVMTDELTKLAEDPDWRSKIKGPIEMMGVNSLGDSSVVLRARVETLADERWSVRREGLRRIKKRFDAEGIEIPFPQLTIHQRGG
jgi:moderate conductance mechanosensitive channel